MNEGYYPDQIVEMVELPDSIKSSPYLSNFTVLLGGQLKAFLTDI